jgi:pyruvate/2-oxoglutarate dehydrogenase complex dihydrolipoamide acyltransferase (E2) component
MEMQVRMPAFGPKTEKATLTAWLVKEGQKVSAGEGLAEVEVEKNVQTLPAPLDGVIAKIVVDDLPAELPVGAVLCVIRMGD